MTETQTGKSAPGQQSPEELIELVSRVEEIDDYTGLYWAAWILQLTGFLGTVLAALIMLGGFWWGAAAVTNGLLLGVLCLAAVVCGSVLRALRKMAQNIDRIEQRLRSNGR